MAHQQAADEFPPRPERKHIIPEQDLMAMMYGFGDDMNSLPETVDLMEDLVVDFIVELTRSATALSRRRGKLQTEDLLFAIRRDRKKYARVRELLRISEQVKRDTQVFSTKDQ